MFRLVVSKLAALSSEGISSAAEFGLKSGSNGPFMRLKLSTEPPSRMGRHLAIDAKETSETSEIKFVNRDMLI